MAQQPQSDDEIRPIIEELRRLDPDLDIRWNPIAREVCSGSFDALGRANPGSFLGRWEVIRSRHDGEPADVVFRVEWDGDRSGEYREVGWWLVEFMRKWDSHQAHFREEIEKMWAKHDAIEAAAGRLDRAGAQEFLDEQHFNMAGPYWIGRGAEFSQ